MLALCPAQKLLPLTGCAVFGQRAGASHNMPTTNAAVARLKLRYVSELLIELNDTGIDHSTVSQEVLRHTYV